MKIYAIINQKGGVGKTTISINLAYGLADQGHSVLLVDSDPQGHSSDPYLSEREEYINTLSEVLGKRNFDIKQAIYPALIDDKKSLSLFILPSNIGLALVAEQLSSRHHREKLLAKALENISKEFDFVIIDCPPNLGVLAINSIYAASNFIIPVRPDKRALDGVSDLFLTISEVKEGQKYSYNLVLNDVDVRNRQTNDYIENELKYYSENLMTTFIRRSESINQAYIMGQSIFSFYAKGNGAKDFSALIEELLSNA